MDEACEGSRFRFYTALKVHPEKAVETMQNLFLHSPRLLVIATHSFAKGSAAWKIIFGRCGP
jgi:hypothetical protein